MRHPLRRPLLLLALLAAATAADLRVAPSGDTGGDGSAAKPFREIRQALAVARPGDVVRVADGSYLGFDVTGVQATAEKPLTIVGDGEHVEITASQDRADNRDNIYVTGCRHVRIENLRSAGAPRAGIRVGVGDHVAVVGCRFADNGMWGIFTDYADDLLIERNECSGSRVQHGIYVSNSCTGAVVRGNRVHHNAMCGLHLNGDINCVMDGRVCDGQIRKAVVEGNVFWANGNGSAINCSGVIDAVIRNNLVHDAHQAGISLYHGEGKETSRSIAIVGNTIEVSPRGKWCVQLHQGVTAVTMFDNILLTRHAEHGAIHLSETDHAAITSDYNLIGGGAHAATLDDDASFIDLAAWRQLGHDQHSRSAGRDELFVAPDAGDFRLKDGCAAIDAGVAALAGTAAPAVDALGIKRPSGRGFDLGAFELPDGHAAR